MSNNEWTNNQVSDGMNIQHWIFYRYENHIFQRFSVTWENAYAIMLSENAGCKFNMKSVYPMYMMDHNHL